MNSWDFSNPNCAAGVLPNCTPTPRFRFVQDDSCHWYAIPEEKELEFNSWIFFTENGETWNGLDFEQFRLNCHISSYSFVDLKGD